MVGSRPREMLQAISQLQMQCVEATSLDACMLTIAATATVATNCHVALSPFATRRTGLRVSAAASRHGLHPGSMRTLEFRY